MENKQEVSSSHKDRCEQKRAAFKRGGVSISGWAKANRLNPSLVHHVLSSEECPARGESHRAAVLLGLKDGPTFESPGDFDPRKAAN